MLHFENLAHVADVLLRIFSGIFCFYDIILIQLKYHVYNCGNNSMPSFMQPPVIANLIIQSAVTKLNRT